MNQSEDHHSHKRISGARAAVIRAAATAFFDALPEHMLWRTDSATLDAIADAAGLDGVRTERQQWVMDALWDDPTLVRRYRRAEIDDQARRIRGVQRANATRTLAAEDVACCSLCVLPARPAEQRVLVADLCNLSEHRVTPQLVAAVAGHLLWFAQRSSVRHGHAGACGRTV